MVVIGRFEDRRSMEEASAIFLRALRGKPTRIENVEEPRLACGHDRKHRYIYKRQEVCRLCKAERDRAARLPDMIENTRTKLAMLEREARRRGQLK
ncbi:hypothetical protein [Qipengyuania sp. MTN3-11]|uniref:hypothetical protein n=1 Tax=Qipengyuania sp. MTN3-11 TaxID=3056557 RepID=UPI0036F1D019